MVGSSISITTYVECPSQQSVFIVFIVSLCVLSHGLFLGFLMVTSKFCMHIYHQLSVAAYPYAHIHSAPVRLQLYPDNLYYFCIVFKTIFHLDPAPPDVSQSKKKSNMHIFPLSLFLSFVFSGNLGWVSLSIIVVGINHFVVFSWIYVVGNILQKSLLSQTHSVEWNLIN